MIKRLIALAISFCVISPSPAAAQNFRVSVAAPQAPGLSGVPSVPQITLPSRIVSPSLSSPLLTPALVPVLSALPAQSVQPLNAVAVKPVPVALGIAAVPLAARPITAAHARFSAVQAVESVRTGDFSALYDGATARPAAAAAETPNEGQSVPAALKPAARTDLKVASAEVKSPGPSKRYATSALAWWRLSGILAPFAALLPSVPKAFGMDATAWLALSALWVGAPALWEAVPAEWKRRYPAAAASAALVAGAAVGFATAAVAGWSMLTAVAATAILGAALAASTAPFGALKRALARNPALLHVDGKDEARRLWIEPAKFGKLMLLTAGFERGLGEKDLHAAKTDAYERAVYFRRTGDYVEIVSRDLSRRAFPGSPLSAALADIAADSTIGKAKIIAEDAATGAVALDLKTLTLQDFFRVRNEIEEAFGARYSLDTQLSGVSRADSYSSNLELSGRYVFEREAYPSEDEPGTRLTDARRVTIPLRLSFSALPEAGYRPRKADPRIGHFATLYEDWTDDQAANPTRTMINRWRLEKSDPGKAASPVKKPIVYWLDHSVPEGYRAAVRRGVLAWNEAFERVGLLGAIEVKDAPIGFDPSDARHTVIKWFVDKDANYAIGQTRVDPLTGEIYQATLGISALHPSAALGTHFVDLGEGGDEKPLGKTGKSKPGAKHVHDHKCRHAAALAKQAQMTLAVLESRGGMSEDEKRRFVEDYIVDLTLHEVGHTLGLRHNFLAKTWKAASELSGEAPLAASVMDYLATNVAPPGAKQGPFWNTRLGPYDFWAIEYAYKPLAPEKEEAELARIAARAGEHGLAYATDEDLTDLDPDSKPWYIGSDPLEWARGRIATVRELWKSLEKNKGEGSGPANYRAFVQGWRGYLDASRLAAAVVGGIGHRRNAGKEAPFTPISGDRRRAALALIEEAIFSDAPFDASADLRRRLEPSREGTVDNPWPGLGWLPYDELTLWLRQDALARLLDPDLMALLSETVKMAPERDQALTPRELIETLTRMIWREVVEPMKRGARVSSISPARRRLQEAHLNMLILLAYRDAEEEVPEVSALARAHLARLSLKLDGKVERKSWDDATRDHLKQAVNKIDSADSRYEP